MKPAVRQRLAGLFIVLLSVDASNQLSHRGPFQSTGPYNHRTSTSTSTSTPTQHWRRGNPAHDQTLLKHQTTTYRSTSGNTAPPTNNSLHIANMVTHETDTHNNLKEVSEITDGKNSTDLASHFGTSENNTNRNPLQNMFLKFLNGFGSSSDKANDSSLQQQGSVWKQESNSTDLALTTDKNPSSTTTQASGHFWNLFMNILRPAPSQSSAGGSEGAVVITTGAPSQPTTPESSHIALPATPASQGPGDSSGLETLPKPMTPSGDNVTGGSSASGNGLETLPQPMTPSGDNVTGGSSASGNGLETLPQPMTPSGDNVTGGGSVSSSGLGNSSLLVEQPDDNSTDGSRNTNGTTGEEITLSDFLVTEGFLESLLGPSSALDNLIRGSFVLNSADNDNRRTKVTLTDSSYNLTTKFWTDCLTKKLHYVLMRPEVIDIFFKSDQYEVDLVGQGLHCKLELKVPENKVMSIELREASAVKEVLAFEIGYLHSVEMAEFNGVMVSAYISNYNSTTKAYSNPGADLLLSLEVTKKDTPPVGMWLSLRLIDKANIPGLETVFTTPISGYVQPHDFDGQAHYLYNNMPVLATVEIPYGFLIMISFHQMDFINAHVCQFAKLSLYMNGRTDDNYLSSPCEQFHFDPKLFRGHTLYVVQEIMMMNAMPMKGFRLLFSFHKKSTPLRRLPGGKWNCSVPYWSEYSHHFPCNLAENCADGRDEVECPYTSPSCKRGYFRVGDKCYLFVPMGKKLSWNEAHFSCHQLQGQMLAFKSQKERENVIALLMEYRQLVHMSLGFTSTPNAVPPIYRWAFQFVDGTIALYVPMSKTTMKKPTCMTLQLYHGKRENMHPFACNKKTMFDHICEFQLADSTGAKPEGVVSVIPNSQPITSEQYAALPSRFVTCPHQHATHTFLACDLQSACWVDRLELCTAPLTPLPPSFECTNGLQRISYTLVCDFRHDCSDSSDETFCQHLPCVLSEFQCQNGQCVMYVLLCDGVKHCLDGSDEARCSSQTMVLEREVFSGPAVVQFDGNGKLFLEPLNSVYHNSSTGCPDNYFRCPGNGYCLPVYTRCNRLYDCPGREDEMECESYTCPGFYRCRGSKICLTHLQICDSIYHCPQYDDELLCGLICPDHCICYGLSWFCSSALPTPSNKQLRFLDATGSGLDLAGVENNTMLIHLSLAGCRITRLESVFMPNMQSFDLRDNLLVSISTEDIAHLPNLQHLSLKGNPLVSVFTEKDPTEQESFRKIFSLDLSHVKMVEFRMDILSIFPNVHSLNLTSCGIERLLVEDNSGILKHLRYLDLRGSPITHFSPDVLQGLSSINNIFSDNYKLCCPALLPSRFNPVNCKAPSDKISSCENLLRFDIYRVFLALFAGFSLLGNLLAFFARVFHSKVKNGFDMLTITLCVSNFLMGVYLAIIGVADRLYTGMYVWEDVNWRHSAVCKAAGFLAMLSSEMSAITVFLLTLDRFLVLQFPSRKLHFSRKGAMMVSCLVLAFGLVLASIPLLPLTSFWNFYSQTGICIPLPITGNDFAGHDYYFAVHVVFTFVLSICVAIGQFSVYCSLQKHALRSAKHVQSSSRDLNLAQRLISVALSDFFCWFPFCLLCILASRGIPIPEEINVAVAIFVMPLNSTLNPYLFAFNKVLEKRQTEKERRLKLYLMKQMKSVKKGHN